jgi:predicted dehydrogenase
MKIGVLGAAAITPQAIIEPAANLGHEVVAVAARDVGRARVFADKYGITRVLPTYADVVSDPEVELLYNPLPNSAHAEWNIRALQANKHILAEKPFTKDVGEAREVVAAAEKSGRVLIEAYHYFFHPLMQRILALLTEGRIGEVRHVEVHMVSAPPPRSDPRWSEALAGGSLMDMGCYGIHVMQRLAFCCGGAPVPQAAHLTMASGPDAVDAASIAFLQYPSGATGSVWSEFRGQGDVLQLTIYGSTGRIIAPNFVAPQQDDRLIIETATGTWGDESYTTTIERLGTTTSYTHQLQAVVAHITEGADLPLSLDDTLATMEVIDWVFANAQRIAVEFP